MDDGKRTKLTSVIAAFAFGLLHVAYASAQQVTNAEQRAEVARALVASVAPVSAADLTALAELAKTRLQEAVRRVLVERAVSDPATASTQAAAQHQLTVVAEKGEVNGRARFYVSLGPNTDAQITFTGPLSGGQTSFATGSGLGQNVSVNASVKVGIWSKEVPVSGLARTSLAVTAVAGQVTSLPEDRQLLAGLELLRRAAATTGDTQAVATAVTEAQDPRLARLLASASLVTTAERFYGALVQQLPELVSTRWAAYITPGFEANRHSVDYLESETTASDTFNTTTGLFTFSGGVSRLAEWQKNGETAKLLTPLFYAGISLRAGDNLQVADKQNVCRAFGTSGATECLDAPVGIPTESNVVSVTAEYRHWAYNQSVGLNPRYTYTRQRRSGAIEKTVHTFEVPIYFMHQVKDINIRDITFGADLTGGVSVGWRDDGSVSGAFVNLFLTKVFGLP